MKYVMFYESSDDVLSTAPIHYPAHAARVEQFHRDGKLLMVGPFEDAQRDGSMGIFTSREAAQEFIDGDPFVLRGVGTGWEIRGWNEGLA